MFRPYTLVSVAVTMLALSGGSAAARAQDSSKAPAAAPAVDSNAFYAGDWEFSAQWRDTTVAGFWRINYSAGRFTGIVTRTGFPPSPIRSFTLRDMRNFTLTADFNSETWTFAGHLDNPRSISGSLTTRGNGIGRLRAQKRS